jgi:DNA helicase-2/ATP-dependent DNA helicase PcrA
MTLFCVGDSDQLLFRFQGAKPELFTGELEQWLSDIETHKLEINYRSQDEIINKGQQLIAHNYSDLGGPYPQEFMKTMTGVKGQGDKIEFAMYQTADEEAMTVGQKINELIQQGYSFGDFFIGARTRAQLGYVEGSLVRAGIKFINITGSSFWQSRHVLDVVSYLRLAYDTSNKDALEQVHNIASAESVYPHWSKDRAGEYCPTRFLGKKFLAAISFDYNKADSVYRAGKYGWRRRTKNQDMTSGQEDLLYFVDTLSSQVATADNMGQVVRTIIDDCYEKYLRHNDTIGDEGLVNAKLEDLATVEDLASRFNSPELFLAYVDENIQAAEDAKNRDWEGYTVISTYHRLKGLERPVIFGLGWCEGENTKTGESVGLLPHTFSLSPPPDFGVLPSGGMSPLEDERCIGYVCVTRAEEKVYLSGIKTYRTWQMGPSRFIYEMELMENE